MSGGNKRDPEYLQCFNRYCVYELPQDPLAELHLANNISCTPTYNGRITPMNENTCNRREILSGQHNVHGPNRDAK